MDPSQSAQSTQAPSPKASQPQQGYQTVEASPEDLGLSQQGRLTHGGQGEQDDIAEALAAAAEAVPLDVEPEESQAESAEAASATAPKPDRIAEPEKKASPAPQTDKVSASDWARFHREKKDFFTEQQAVKAEKAEIERVKTLLANAKTDRLAALEALGYTDIKEFVEGLAQDGGRMTPERRELNELKAWRQSQEKAAEDAKAQSEAQAQQAALQGKLDALRGQIKERLQSDDHAESIVNLKDADEQVMLEMDRMATASGQMPDLEEAIGNVRERFTSHLEEMASNPGIMAFFAEKLGNRQSPQAATPQSKQRAKVRTIGGKTPSAALTPKESSRASANLDDDVEAAIFGLKEMAR